MSILGDTGFCNAPQFNNNYPNNAESLYGESAQYRLRLYTTGGFSPDGVAAVKPTDFAKFFRIRVTNTDNTESWITQDNVTYHFPQGNIEVIGLADLGKVGESINDAYVEDFDNYIDIVLYGDESAMRRITAVEIPTAAESGYQSFYNPGGPGNNPTPGVIYTQPGPYCLESIIMAIDDPMTVNYGQCSN